MEELNEELKTIFLRANALLAKCKLLVPDERTNLDIDFAEDGLKNYLKWLTIFLKDQGFDH